MSSIVEAGTFGRTISLRIAPNEDVAGAIQVVGTHDVAQGPCERGAEGAAFARRDLLDPDVLGCGVVAPRSLNPVSHRMQGPGVDLKQHMEMGIDVGLVPVVLAGEVVGKDAGVDRFRGPASFLADLLQ